MVFERNMPRPRRLSAPSKIVATPKAVTRKSIRTTSVESKGHSAELVTPSSDVLISIHDRGLVGDTSVPRGWDNDHDKMIHSKPRLVETNVNTVIQTNMEGMGSEHEVTRATVFHSHVHLNYRDRTNH